MSSFSVNPVVKLSWYAWPSCQMMLPRLNPGFVREFGNRLLVPLLDQLRGPHLELIEGAVSPAVSKLRSPLSAGISGE